MDAIEVWELLAYIVTVFGLPFAILVFVHEQRKARENEEEQTWLLLSDGYTRFLELVIANPDLKMRSERATSGLTEEQQERALAMFAILVALFERAYLLAYEERMSGKKLRRWRSWEDYMREWCAAAPISDLSCPICSRARTLSSQPISGGLRTKKARRPTKCRTPLPVPLRAAGQRKSRRAERH